MREPLPLHRIQEAIFEFCRGRADVVVFGAQAVNVYVSTPRMTQDVDLLCCQPREQADALAKAIGDGFRIAARVREVIPGKGFRVYQLRREGNRHFADVRLADFPLDDSVELGGIRYVSLPTIVALKVRALSRRRLAPKGATDLPDLLPLLLSHPELRSEAGPVAASIERTGGGDEVVRAWRELLAEPMVADESEDQGY